VRTMNKLLRLFFLLALATSGWVLAAPGQEAGPEQPSAHEQRRAELKAALQSQRQNSARETPRQLSPEERMTLRQQLRQQHEAGSRKP
jgi:hypothetical protein